MQARSSLYAADWPQKRDFAKIALQIGKNVWFLPQSDENDAFLTAPTAGDCKTCAGVHNIVQLDLPVTDGEKQPNFSVRNLNS
jgi:hypothetical protein